MLHASLRPALLALLLGLAARPAPAAPAGLSGLDALYPSLDALYLDLHRNPELSSHEEKTAAKLSARMRTLGYEVTEHVGGTGVVAVLKNGPGATVLIRTDLDALPVREQTGDEVKLQITIRSDKPEVQAQLLAAIARVAKGEAAASGAPKEPLVTHDPDKTAHAVYNDPALTQRLAAALRRGLGDANVAPADPVMVSEDFGAFGTAARAPSVLLWLGAAEPGAFAKAKESGTPLPNWHTAAFAPDREATLRTGVATLTLSVLDLLGK